MVAVAVQQSTHFTFASTSLLVYLIQFGHHLHVAIIKLSRHYSAWQAQRSHLNTFLLPDNATAWFR
jgi:hypothetical protein